MAFQRPTLPELISRAQADIESRLPGSSPSLPNPLLSILARMNAGASHELYGAISYLATNLLPTTQDPDILEQWAQVYAVPRLSAVASTGGVHFEGSGAVPEGTLLQGANGQRYQTLNAINAPAIANVQAVQAGAAGNLPTGELTLISPIAGIASKATIDAGGIVGGADIESVENWSYRLLQRIQNPPQGGAASDYERWARASHPDITHAWVFPTTPQPGQVTIYVMSYGVGNGIPDSAVVELVNVYVQAERPVAAQVFIYAPVPKVLDFTVKISPFTPDMPAAVQAALADLFQREAAPGAVIPLSHVAEAVSGIFGEDDHRIEGLSQGDLTPTDGEILLLGTVTVEALL